MKMGSGLIFAIILIVIGLSIIFKVLFDINIFRIVVAVAFILFGVKLLIGKPIIHTPKRKSENHVIFGERDYKFSSINETEYNTIFGKTVYDFRDINSLDSLQTKVIFNTIFGNTDIYLPEGIPLKIKTDAVFSAAIMPNGNTVAFGSTKYTSPNAADSADVLKIEAHVIFGALNIRQ